MEEESTQEVGESAKTRYINDSSNLDTIPFDVEQIIDTDDNEVYDWTANFLTSLKNLVAVVNRNFFTNQNSEFELGPTNIVKIGYIKYVLCIKKGFG